MAISSTRSNIAVLLGVFSASLLILGAIFWNFPELDE